MIPSLSMLEHGISLLALTGISWVYASGLQVSLQSQNNLNKLEPESAVKTRMPEDLLIHVNHCT